MRFLCLHGKGTSAAIFRSQTASFRLQLDPTYTFDFIDGAIPANPAPGISTFYSGPYYSFYNGTSTSEILAAHTFLDSHLLDPITRKARYDGVMGFSQGCAVIASYIMYRQQRQQEKDKEKGGLPFKVAVFICGGLPLGVVEDLGGEVGKECWQWDEWSCRDLHTLAGELVNLKPGMDPWAPHRQKRRIGVGTGDAGGSGGGGALEQPAEEKKDGDKNTDIRYGLDFSKIPPSLTIRIPTVHIYGVKDPRAIASLLLSEFCDDGKNRQKRIFGHPGGHEIPRHKDVSEEIAELIEWISMLANMY